MTINIRGCLHALETAGKPLSQDVVRNLNALVTVRDSAAHYSSPAEQRSFS